MLHAGYPGGQSWPCRSWLSSYWSWACIRSLPWAWSRFFAARIARSRVDSDFTAGGERMRSTDALSHAEHTTSESAPTFRTNASNRFPQAWQEYS